MLPAASWSAIMNTLNRHYGVDASLDGSAARELTRWLTDNASQRSANRPPDDRLTLGADFIRKHREVPTTTWSKAAVKSPANCAACHGDAAEGAFRERNVRIPR
jgi:mono/diheme cytochrome c family protein